MGSFSGHTFKEFGQGGVYAAPPADGGAVDKDLPTNVSITQAIGAGAPRFNLVVRVSKAELIALYDAVLDDGSLVYGYETVNALLCGVTDAAEQGAGHDVYLATLDVIRL